MIVKPCSIYEKSRLRYRAGTVAEAQAVSQLPEGTIPRSW